LEDEELDEALDHVASVDKPSLDDLSKHL
jgi:hypothetical protein